MKVNRRFSMPQDAFTLKFLCEELNDLLKGGKVNRIVQPDNDQVVLTVYTGKKTEKLLLCVNPGCPRIGIVKVEKESPLTAPNFCMLLRKYLLSATINQISLVGFDRIVKIEFLPSEQFFDSEKKVLFVELMGRYSNVILTENDIVLGAIRGVNVLDNGVRPLFVGKRYTLPPVGDKLPPNDRALIPIFSRFNGENLANFICSVVQGLALSTAQEIADLIESKNGIFKIDFANDLFEILNDFVYNKIKNPCIIKDGENLVDVCVYPYSNVDGESVFFDKLFLAEDEFFSKKEERKMFTQTKDRFTNLVNSSIKKSKKKLTTLYSRLKEAQDAESNRVNGELILANIYKIHRGMTTLKCVNYYDNNERLIVLDGNLTPSENAEKYYKKYNKQKRTLTALAPQIETAEKEYNYFVGVLEEIALCENNDDLNAVFEELENVGVVKTLQKAKKVKNTQTLGRRYYVDGFNIYVGRSNLENDKITFSAKPDDVWLHVKDYHSSHVIIQTNGGEVSEKVLLVASSLSAYYSKCRDGGKVEVVYTKRKHVKKPPKSKPGFCVYDNFNSIVVEPNKYSEFLKSE